MGYIEHVYNPLTPLSSRRSHATFIRPSLPPPPPPKSFECQNTFDHLLHNIPLSLLHAKHKSHPFFQVLHPLLRRFHIVSNFEIFDQPSYVLLLADEPLLPTNILH